jgi:hypothetical protein
LANLGIDPTKHMRALPANILLVVIIVVLAWQLQAAVVSMGATGGSDVFYAGYARNAWQAYINSDLMAGLALASAWIVFRERSLLRSITLVMIILYWGNIVISAYALHQLHRARGDWARFFLGTRAAGVCPVEHQRPASLLWRYSWYAMAVVCAGYAVWGIVKANFALYTVIGCLWGFGLLSVGCVIIAASRRSAR